MRNFINWAIIQRIEDSPEKFIVQRKVSLMNSFLFGYENIFLRPENEEHLGEKYKDMPSIDEYARKKYHAEKIGTRNFESVISFSCEDERDFFRNYLDFLKEYEDKFPLDHPILYIPRKTPKFSVKELMGGMRRRYSMYFGNYDLSELRAFLDGYFLCKDDYLLSWDQFDTDLKRFTQNIACETLHLTGKFVTWDRKYRYDRDWNAWGSVSEKHAKEILENFWSDLERFTGEKIG